MNLSENVWLVAPNQKPAVHAARVFLSRLQAGLDRMTAFWAARRHGARQAEVLHAFSDRELWDLGLSRSDIPGIIKGTYRRD